MALPPSLFEELEDVTMLLMTKAIRVGRNFSYSLGDPDEAVVYTMVEEELSQVFWDERRLPLKLKITFGDAEVMRLERVLAHQTCFNLRPYTLSMAVFAPAGNLIGHLRRQNFYSIMDENRQQIMNLRHGKANLFGPMPMKVCRLNTQQEPVALVGRRTMFDGLEGVRVTPPQRWCVRFLEAPMSLKEKVLILAAVLYVDYLEKSISTVGVDPFSGRRGVGRGQTGEFASPKTFQWK